MSRRGNCWDNAVIESFHSSLKSEEFQYVKFNSLSNKDVIERVTNYLVYYNSERIQEKLGYLTRRKKGERQANKGGLLWASVARSGLKTTGSFGVFYSQIDPCTFFLRLF